MRRRLAIGGACVLHGLWGAGYAGYYASLNIAPSADVAPGVAFVVSGALTLVVGKLVRRARSPARRLELTPVWGGVHVVLAVALTSMVATFIDELWTGTPWWFTPVVGLWALYIGPPLVLEETWYVALPLSLVAGALHTATDRLWPPPPKGPPPNEPAVRR